MCGACVGFGLSEILCALAACSAYRDHIRCVFRAAMDWCDLYVSGVLIKPRPKSKEIARLNRGAS